MPLPFLLTSGTAQTAPPFIPTIIGVGGKDWPAVAAGATLFLLPVMIFTILLRKHLLRGHHLRGGAEMTARLQPRFFCEKSPPVPSRFVVEKSFVARCA